MLTLSCLTQALLAAVAAKASADEVKGLIEKLRETSVGVPKPAQSSVYTGTWELLWDYSVRPARSSNPCRAFIHF